VTIAVLHDPVAENAAPDDLDNLVQAQSVGEALFLLGHEVRLLPYEGAARTEAALRELAPRAVFNLSEGIGGAGGSGGAGAWEAAALLERLGLPFTGSCAAAMRLADDKREAKKRLAASGLPSPAFFAPGSGAVIVKSATEHASLGLDAGCVLQNPDAKAVTAALAEKRERFGGEWIAERYVDGREFNVSVIASRGPDGAPEVLPPAEIVFDPGFGDAPRIVGYAAKWHDDSPESRMTVRSFEFPDADRPLLDRLADLAGRAFTAFGLSGYARVDFRVDASGEPFIIDVNANPCLSPDAGFAAALAKAGMTYAQGVDRILQAALAKRA